MKVAPAQADAIDQTSSRYPSSADVQRNGSNIRKRFLLRLGFESLPPKDMPISPSLFSSLHTKPRFCAESYQAPLNAAADCPEKSSHTTQTQRRVSFCSSVTVIPIPSHSDFSDRIKRSLWTSASELHEQVMRNCVEFAAEGWNWKLVVEESNMIWHGGKQVHPCHFPATLECERFSARDRFLHCLATQQAAQRHELGYSY